MQGSSIMVDVDGGGSKYPRVVLWAKIKILIAQKLFSRVCLWIFETILELSASSKVEEHFITIFEIFEGVSTFGYPSKMILINSRGENMGFKDFKCFKSVGNTYRLIVAYHCGHLS